MSVDLTNADDLNRYIFPLNMAFWKQRKLLSKMLLL